MDANRREFNTIQSATEIQRLREPCPNFPASWPLCLCGEILPFIRVYSRSFAVDFFICVYLRSSAVVCLNFVPVGRIETFDSLNESLFHRRIGKVCGPYAAFQSVRGIEGDQFPAID
jgi:hypothetical protein